MSLSKLTRRQKRYLFLSFDSLLVPFALILAYVLRFSDGLPPGQLETTLPLLSIMMVLAPVVAVVFRLPWIKLMALDVSSIGRIASAAVLLGVAAMSASYLLQLGAPRSIPILMMVLFFTLSVFGRMMAAFCIGHMLRDDEGVSVAIYGAGAAGIQLASALRQSTEVHPVTFVDDNPSLRGLIISGLSVISRDGLRTMVEQGQVARILVAMPSLPKSQIDTLLDELEELPCEVQVLPSYVDMIAGRGTEMKTVSPDALLGRDKVALDVPDIAKAYAGRCVMVTGAGGSIGSELCRQLLDCNPARIVFFEQSELALYEVDRELRNSAAMRGIAVSARLGTVVDAHRVTDVITSENVDIILHAAAYKHVPLVEQNELEGARNNAIGTHTIAQAAEAAGVERFILVSTDKAVRPTNIMGATKRMAELVTQDMASRATETRFSMVRFGNVLGSSGSVLPLFQDQIMVGGPVTVTHPDVTRFFMTIPEAARLVLLAGAYSKGGDVFVLDMGKPMRILEIARRMIELSGAKVREDGDDDGIEIKITGLRPGEKLYEELLIDSDSMVATPHAKILRAKEIRLSQIEVAGMVREVRAAIEGNDVARLRVAVEGFVSGYHPATQGNLLTDASA